MGRLKESIDCKSDLDTAWKTMSSTDSDSDTVWIIRYSINYTV